jgi:hypothetical protein
MDHSLSFKRLSLMLKVKNIFDYTRTKLMYSTQYYFGLSYLGPL